MVCAWRLLPLLTLVFSLSPLARAGNPCLQDRLKTLLSKDRFTLETLAKTKEFNRKRFGFSYGRTQHTALETLSPEEDYLFFHLENTRLKSLNDTVGKQVATGATIQYKTLFMAHLEAAAKARGLDLKNVVAFEDYKAVTLRFGGKRGDFFQGAGGSPTPRALEIEAVLNEAHLTTQTEFARRARLVISDPETLFTAGISGAERTPVAAELLARWIREFPNSPVTPACCLLFMGIRTGWSSSDSRSLKRFRKSSLRISEDPPISE